MITELCSYKSSRTMHAENLWYNSGIAYRYLFLGDDD